MDERHEHHRRHIDAGSANADRRTDRQRANIQRHAERQEADRRRTLARLEPHLSDAELDRGLSSEQRRGVIRGSAIALAVLAVLLLWVVTSLGSYPSIAERFSLLTHPGILPFVVAAACFLPLAFRDEHPVAALVATSVLTGVYLALPWPPAIVILAPMTALFTVAERYGGRRTVPIGIVLGIVVLGVSALTVSLSYTVAQIVAVLALLGLSAALGHGAQTRRELFEEIRRQREETDRRRLEEERLRIAREVHDVMAHSLTLMTVQADAGLATIGDGSDRARDALAVIGDTGRATLRDLRSMLNVLTAGEDGSPREPMASLSALAGLVESVRETGLDVTLEREGDIEAVPMAIGISAYRVIQESLTNVVRHAHARHATVRVAATDSGLEIDVTDDGIGRATEVSADGRGLRGMSERVGVLHGDLTAGPGPEGGFRVSARIPLPRAT